jgi:hypothetical protein
MDHVTLIRAISGVMFAVVLFILVKRRKGQATGG